MNKSEQGNILIALLLIAVVVGGGAYYFFFMNQNMPSTPTMPTMTDAQRLMDINRDEKVDQTDLNYITSNINCKSADPCWNTVIGKTSDGDNPIYVYDLDLNKDGVIDQGDAAKIIPGN